MFETIKKFIKYRRLISKIRSKLPIRHPITGQWLDWDIGFIKPKVTYESMTGKMIEKGYPSLIINQKCPGSILVDNNVYTYNWKKKKIERVSGCKWR